MALDKKDLKKMKDKHNVKGVLQALREDNYDIRSEAIEYILDRKDPILLKDAILIYPSIDLFHAISHGDLTVLEDTIVILKEQLNNKDPYERLQSVDALSEIGGPKVSTILLETLRNESDPYVRRMIVRAFFKEEKRLTIEDPKTINFLLGTLKNSGGKILDAYLEILSNIENPSILYDAFRKLKLFCPKTQESCNKTFQETNEYFVAHPFSPDRIDDLRRAINVAVQGIFPDLRPYYADQEIRGDVYCKICLKIQSVKFGIYDISETCPTCHKSNPNVALELGLAYGLNKPTVLIIKKDSQIISDLQGFDRIEYTSYTELEKELRLKIRNVFNNRG